MEANTWCRTTTKAAVLEWLRNVLAKENLSVENYRDLKDGHLLFKLLQTIQSYSTTGVVSRRSIPARPCARFAKINEFIQDSVKIGSIYSLNVGAILNYGDEQELCKAAVLMLFLGSLEQESPILAAGIALQPDHQVALQEILKIVQNKPEPAICLDNTPTNPPTVNTTPPDRQLAAIASSSIVDSPLLAQLMESPFSSSKKQTVYSQLRRLKLKVLGLEDERDMVQQDKKKVTAEMGEEINELKSELTHLQSLLSSYYSEEDYRALEVEVNSLQKANTQLGAEVEEMTETKQRIKLLESVTDSDAFTIERLQKENQALTAELSALSTNCGAVQEKLEQVQSEVNSLEEELKATKTFLSVKEEENSSLKQMMTECTSHPDTPIMSTGENVGDILLMEAQGEITEVQDKLAVLTEQYGSLSDAHSKLETQHSVLEKEKLELHEKYDLQIFQIESLKTSLTEQLGRYDELQSLSDGKIEYLNSLLENTKHQVEVAKSEHDALQSDLCAKTETCAILETQLKTIQEQFKQFSTVKGEEIDELAMALERLGKEKESEARKFEEETTQMTTHFQKARATLETQIACGKTQISDLESEVCSLNAMVTDLSTQLDTSISSLAQVKVQFSAEETQLKERISILEAEASSLRQNLSDSEKQLITELSRSEEKDEAHRIHVQQLEVTRQQVQQSLESSVSDLNCRVSDLSTQLEAEKASLADHLVQFSQEQTQLTNKIKALEGEALISQQNLMECKEELIAAFSSAAEKDETHSAQICQLETSSQQAQEALQNSISGLNCEIADLSMRLESERTSLAELTAEFSLERKQRNDHIDSLEKKNSTLQMSLAKSEQQLSAELVNSSEKEEAHAAKTQELETASQKLEETVSAIQRELTEKVRGITVLETKCAELEQQQESIKAKKSSSEQRLNKVIEDLQAHCTEVVAERDILHEKQNQSQKVIEDLQISQRESTVQLNWELADLQKQCDVLRQEKDQLNQAFTAEMESREALQVKLNQEMANAAAKLEMVEDNASKVQREMTEELELTIQRLEQTGVKIEDLEVCNAQYSCSLANLEEQLQTEHQANSSLSQRIQEVEDKSENDLAEWSLERASLLQNVGRLETQVNVQQDQAHHLGLSLENLEKQLGEWQQRYLESEENVNLLTEKWTSVNTKLEDGCNTISHLKESNQVQEKQLELLTNERDRLGETVEQLQEDLRGKSSNIIAINEEIDQLKATVSAAKKENEKQKDLFEAKESTLESKLETKSTELQLIQEANNSLKVELAELVQVQSSLKETHSDFEAQQKLVVACLEDTVESLQCRIKKLVEENTALSQQSTNLQEALDTAKHSNAVNEEQLNQETSRLQSLIQDKCQSEDNLQSEVEQLVLSNKKLSEKCDATIEELTRINMQHDEIESAFSATTQTLMQTNERNSDLIHQLRQLFDQIKLLPSFTENDNISHVDSMSDIQPYLFALDSLHMEYTSQQQQLSSALTVNRDNTDVITKLELTRNQLQTEIAQLISNVEEATQTHQNKEAQSSHAFSNLEAQHQSVKDSLALKCTEAVNLKCQVQALDEEKTSLESTVSHLETCRVTLEEANAGLHGEMDKSQNREKALQCELNKLKSDLLQVKERSTVAAQDHAEAMETMHNDFQQKMESLREHSDHTTSLLTTQCSELESEVSALQDKNDFLQHEVESITSELGRKTEICAEVDILRSELSACKERELATAARCGELDEQVMVLNAQFRTTSSELDRLQANITEKDQLIHQLNCDLAESNETCDSLKNEIEQTNLKTEELRQQAHSNELTQLKDLLEQERAAAAKLQQQQNNQQMRIAELDDENLRLSEHSEAVQTQLNAATQNNNKLERKMETFNETTDILERYKVSYKEKKVTIERQKHELKLSKALADKYKEDLQRYKTMYENLQCEIKQNLKSIPTVAVDDSHLKMEELESTLTDERNVSRSQNLSMAETQRRRSMLSSAAAVNTYGDDEADVLIDAPLNPMEGNSIFAEAAAASVLLGNSTRKEEDLNERIAELQRRNASYLPHLRSAYPIESQIYTPSKPRSDEIREAKEVADAADSQPTISQANRSHREKSENMAPESVGEQSLKRPINVAARGIATISNSAKVFAAIENEVTTTASSVPPVPKDLRAAAAYLIQNTPKELKRRSFRGKLRSVLPSSKK